MNEGAWVQFRGDAVLAGRSPLLGDIVRPGIRWRHFIGARETLIAVQPAGERDTADIALPEADIGPQGWRELSAAWGITAPRYDLDGDGSLHSVGPSIAHKVGRFLPGEPGLQKVEFESLFDWAMDPTKEVYGRLFTRRDAGWREVWRSEAVPWLYSANAIVGDFDGDGALEVAAVPWDDLWVLDMATGRRKAICRFKPQGAESGRAYGWLGAFDLNGDGKDEFIILSDFENHVEVIGWQGDSLAVVWGRLIERGISRKRTILHPGTNPVQDIDGDGKPEIVVSIFGDAGEPTWRVLALDGMTGARKLDLPGRYLSGLVDLDGDGVAELLSTEAPDLFVPTAGEISVLSARGGEVRALWDADDAGFERQPIQDFPPNVNSGAATGRVTALTGAMVPGGRPVFVVRRVVDRDAGLVELALAGVEGSDAIRTLGRLCGPNLEALALQPDRGLLLRAQMSGDGSGSLMVGGFHADPILSRSTPAPLSNPVAGRLVPGATPAIVVEGAPEQVVALTVEGDATRLLWHRPGRGMCTGDTKQAGGLSAGGCLLADLLGDGRREVIAATYGPEGCARLVALTPEGRMLWHHDFDRFAGAPPTWNVGGLTLWCAGRFTGRAGDDVMVSLRRSTMHSDETYLLDGRTGRIVWERTEGGTAGNDARGCGGAWVAVYDHDGDGSGDALSMYPDVVYVIDGATGVVPLDLWTYKAIFEKATYYAVPVVADFLGDGSRQMLYGASAYQFALLRMDGSVIWKKDGPMPVVLPGIGDFDGDSRLELMSFGHAPSGVPQTPESREHEVRLFDAATGELRWTLPFPGSCFGMNGGRQKDSPMTPATGDIDGDGRDECIIAIGSMLYAVGVGADGTGEIAWRLDFPDDVASPAIADLDGNGRPTILIVCGDGYLYGVGNSP